MCISELFFLAVPLRAAGMQRVSGGGVGSPNRTSGKGSWEFLPETKLSSNSEKLGVVCVRSGLGLDCRIPLGRKAKVKEFGRGEKPFLHSP